MTEEAEKSVRPAMHTARPEETALLDEATMAHGWLEHLRRSVLYKLEGLSDSQLRWKPSPSANSLGGIAVHLGYCERLWVRAVFAGEALDLSFRSHMFEVPDGWSVDDVADFYRTETGAADAVLDAAETFDARSLADFRPTTLRWIVVHLIEETARHAGHMDITRELIDGSTGR